MMRQIKFWQQKFYHFPMVGLGVLMLAATISAANGAAVVSRGGGASANTASRAPRVSNAASRTPTLSTVANSKAQAATEQDSAPAPGSEPTPAPDTTPVTEPEPETEAVIIENKASQFDESLRASGTSTTDKSASELAEQIRRQRAALDAQDATNVTSATVAAAAAGQSACDTGLRACMQEKCGTDYTKCATDGDTIWGDKMDACRRNLTCTGHEYTVFTREIKADRDMNVKLASYNEVLKCGNQYNDCIATECGINYNKCLGKAAGDAAVAKCATIAKNCTQADSGLASRTGNVFATLRQEAEKQIAADEKRLYALRDEMKTQCARLGAMFDERSLDCVFTINFYADNSTTPYASKKGYAGSTFNCTQNWFGVDITTFKENAYRLTRSQTAASNAMLGSGVGQAVGAITSGAIDRAVDRKKATDAVKKAQKEHDANYGDNNPDNAPPLNNSGNGSGSGSSQAATPSPDLQDVSTDEEKEAYEALKNLEEPEDAAIPEYTEDDLQAGFELEE